MTALVFQLIQQYGLKGLAIITASGAILMCGLIAIAIQLGWKKSMANTRLRWLPGALPAVVGVTLLSLFWEMPRVTLEPLLPLVKAAGMEFLTFNWVAGSTMFWLPALGVAVVASAESLLTARAVDTLVQSRPGYQPANLNKELFAQGAANMISGAIGGLPMTAVMVRSAANVDSGARTRLSTILHGTWIAAFVGLLPFVIAKVPLTALAAVLILTGYKLLAIPQLIHEVKTHPRDGFLWVATALLILSTDLLTGLIAALVLAAVMNWKAIYAWARNGGRTVAISEGVSVDVNEKIAN
jgi:MFS superfamily sulfate permease-like transporter